MHERTDPLISLLDAALDLPVAARDHWLDSLPSEHEQLRPRLRALLERAARVETKDFLETLPKFEIGAPAESPGKDIGPYRLVREIGAGGMGAVWLAERHDGALKRAVALKFLRAHGPRDALAERLIRERDILAGLVHPGIARLYDAGISHDGLSYLALEHIEGVHIDEYCRLHNLDIRARLRLLVQVAQAVAYAHSKLVVHRDLKPSNILVSADARVHLLDFGIAKLLEDGRALETRLTQVAGRALTPEYASPEQILGEPITTASDIYSLGVILCELLANSRPYRLKRNSRGALEDAILEIEPQRPSDLVQSPLLRRALRGDLDAIVLKALKKKPQERYATLNALGDDIDRFLTGRPVLAQPDSAVYRVGKFAKRNKLPVTLAAAALLMVLVGAGAALWQARVAIAEQQRAQEVREFIESIFVNADPFGQSGRPLTAVELLRQAQARIDGLSKADPEQRVDLLNTLGSSMLNLRDLESAEAVLREAAVQGKAALGPEDRHVLRARRLLAQVLVARGRYQDANHELAEVIPDLQRKPIRYPQELVAALLAKAKMHNASGAYEAAEATADEVLRTAEVLGMGNTAESVGALIQLSYAHNYRRQFDPALDAARRAYGLAGILFPGSSHPVVNDARMQYAVALVDIDDLERALQLMREGQRNAIAVFGADSQIAGEYSRKMSQYLGNGGYVKESLAASERAMQILGPQLDQSSLGYAALLDLRAGALLAVRQGAPALVDATRAREIVVAQMGAKHESAFVLQVYRARALALAGNTDESSRLLREVVERYAASGGYSTTSTPMHFLGVATRLAGEPAQALAMQQKALDTIPAGGRARRLSSRVLVESALNRIELEDLAGARTDLETALKIYADLYQVMHPIHADALVAMARIELTEGRPNVALEHIRKADSFWRELEAENRWAGEAALWLGRTQLALGNPAQADRELSRARRILAQSKIPIDRPLLALAQARPVTE